MSETQKDNPEYEDAHRDITQEFIALSMVTMNRGTFSPREGDAPISYRLSRDALPVGYGLEDATFIPAPRGATPIIG